MATNTTRLVLRKPDPDPVTGDDVNVQTDLNDNFDKIDAAAGFEEATSGARPASPYNGKGARESDTGNLIVYNGTVAAWRRAFYEGQASWPEAVAVRRAAVGNGAFSANITADTQNRFSVTAAGIMAWGTGALAEDTNLYRASASVLKTDDTFNAVLDVQVNGASVSRGLIAWSERGTNSTAASGAQGVIRLDDISILAGRAYVISTSSMIMLSTVAADIGTARLSYTTDGSTPTTGSTLFAVGNRGIANTTHGEETTLKRLYIPAGNETLSLLLFTQRLAGTGNISLNVASGGSPIQIFVWDLGVAPTEIGTDL